ncbi:MAG: CBS domain-containing protein [Solirubrobacterales bacterium]|nr:CBS domain-containing protein [Solirubrobacterales bacterium]
MKLRRRGIEIDEPRSSSVMTTITVAEAMETPPHPLHPDQTLEQVVTRFAQERSDSLPVVDGAKGLVGTVAAVDVERAVRQRFGDGLVAAALAREAPPLSVHESLEDAVAVLSATDEDGVPVVSPDGEALIGWLTHRGLLSAYHTRAGSRG